MRKNYGHDFYKDRHQKTVYSATTILSKVLEAIPEVNSAVDFGCGVGTWLSVLKGKAVKDIQGIDGAWVDKSLLEIPESNFLQIDFEEPIQLNKKYDLAISLEVAEHLPISHAKAFVENLVNASDFILFSAAIPFQGGRNHVNEQWQNYWLTLFNEKNFTVIDFIRGEIWDDQDIPTWYRQNTLFFVHKERVKEIKLASADTRKQLPIALVHPDAYLSKMNQLNSVKGSFGLFLRALKRWGKHKLASAS
jgi:cyclopropane fatty-acyl-phospholipid synthase-like methyltransferase